MGQYVKHNHAARPREPPQTPDCGGNTHGEHFIIPVSRSASLSFRFKCKLACLLNTAILTLSCKYNVTMGERNQTSTKSNHNHLWSTLRTLQHFSSSCKSESSHSNTASSHKRAGMLQTLSHPFAFQLGVCSINITLKKNKGAVHLYGRTE